MPKAIHDKLEKEALKKFGTTTSDRAQAYIYGTLHRIESGQKTKKKK